MTDDALAAELAALRALASAPRERIRDLKALASATPRLLAAVEAVLKPHQPGRNVVFGDTCELHEGHRHFSITEPEARSVRDCPDCSATVYVSCYGCGPHMPLDSCPVRAAITRALTGEDGQ